MYLSLKEACAYTGKTRKTIERHMKLGHFITQDPVRHSGKRVFIDRDSINAYYLPGYKPRKKA